MARIITVLSLLFIVSVVSASESGLLLGLRYGTNYDISATPLENKALEEKRQPSSYRTFWIRAEDGKVELAAERTSLLVPQDDGFWRIDVKHSVYNDFREDFVWINPAPDFDAIPNPFLAEQEGIKAFDVSLLVKDQSITPTLGEYCEGQASRDILFVGNEYLSVGYVRGEICSGFMGGSTDSALQMLSLEELDVVDIGTLLKHKSAFQRAALEHKTRHTDSGDWGDVSSGIVRYHGQWVAKGHYPKNEGGYTHFDVPIVLSEELVFHNELYPDWKTIRKHVPDVVDAFSSPSKDLLVVLTETGSLLAFNLKKGKINPQPALHILFKYPVSTVMARWTEGLNVSNWTEELNNLGKKPQQTWFTQASIPSVEESQKVIGVVVTPGKRLNIRQGIGQQTKPIAKVKKGVKIDILDVLGQWYKVELDDGIVGYAHNDYVKILPKLPYIQQACPIDNCRYGDWTLKQSTILYAQPSFKADALETLKASQVVQALNGEIQTTEFGEIEVITPQVELTDDNQKLSLSKGDKLFDLESVGLGMHLVWYNGELYYLNNGWNSDRLSPSERWGSLLTERKTDWWVKVNVPEKNISGWIANPEADGMSH
jgi:hypothetical protein